MSKKDVKETVEETVENVEDTSTGSATEENGVAEETKEETTEDAAPEMTEKEKKAAEKEAKKAAKEKARLEKIPKAERKLMEQVTELEDKIQNLEEVNLDTKDKLLRLAAEYDNSKKRAVKDLEEAHKYGATRIIESMVTVMDNIDMAFLNIKDDHLENEHFKKFVDGVKMISDSLTTNLEKNGLKKFNPVNEPFDAKVHDAMMMQPTTEVEDGIIMNVFQPGYELNGRVIRHAKVIVAKNDTPVEPKEEELEEIVEIVEEAVAETAEETTENKE